MDYMRELILNKVIVQNYNSHYSGRMTDEEWQREALVLDVNTAGVMLQVVKQGNNARGLCNGDVYFEPWHKFEFKLKK